MATVLARSNTQANNGREVGYGIDEAARTGQPFTTSAADGGDSSQESARTGSEASREITRHEQQQRQRDGDERLEHNREHGLHRGRTPTRRNSTGSISVNISNTTDRKGSSTSNIHRGCVQHELPRCEAACRDIFTIPTNVGHDHSKDVGQRMGNAVFFMDGCMVIDNDSDSEDEGTNHDNTEFTPIVVPEEQHGNQNDLERPAKSAPRRSNSRENRKRPDESSGAAEVQVRVNGNAGDGDGERSPRTSVVQDIEELPQVQSHRPVELVSPRLGKLDRILKACFGQLAYRIGWPKAQQLKVDPEVARALSGDFAFSKIEIEGEIDATKLQYACKRIQNWCSRNEVELDPEVIYGTAAFLVSHKPAEEQAVKFLKNTLSFDTSMGFGKDTPMIVHVIQGVLALGVMAFAARLIWWMLKSRMFRFLTATKVTALRLTNKTLSVSKFNSPPLGLGLPLRSLEQLILRSVLRGRYRVDTTEDSMYQEQA